MMTRVHGSAPRSFVDCLLGIIPRRSYTCGELGGTSLWPDDMKVVS